MSRFPDYSAFAVTNTKVTECPNGGLTLIHYSCGHSGEHVNHFTYRVGNRSNCHVCYGKAVRKWVAEQIRYTRNHQGKAEGKLYAVKTTAYFNTKAR